MSSLQQNTRFVVIIVLTLCAHSLFIFFVSVIPWGIHAIKGLVQAGDFTTLVTLTAGMVSPLVLLGSFVRNTTMYAGAMMAVDDILKRGSKLAESDSPTALNVELAPLRNELVVDDVAFTYSGGKSFVLNGVNLTIRKGTYTALCGTSGSG